MNSFENIRFFESFFSLIFVVCFSVFDVNSFENIRFYIYIYIYCLFFCC